MTNNEQNELRKIIDRFFFESDLTIESDNNEWKIASGGYDLVAEIYHNNIPVCGIIYAIEGYEVEDYQENSDIVKIVTDTLKSENIKCI